MTEISMKKPSIPRARQLRISVAVNSHIPSPYLESCRCKAANALGRACALTSHGLNSCVLQDADVARCMQTLNNRNTRARRITRTNDIETLVDDPGFAVHFDWYQ